MEDKELQELFDAKRWQEENQRQQEAIAAAIGGSSRRWIGWTTTAAAVIAAVLLMMLPLHKEPEATPMLVAQAEVPIAPQQLQDEGPAAAPSPAKAHKQTVTIEKKEKTDAIENKDAIEKVDAIENVDYIEEEEFQETIAKPAGPRIHRRRGNLLAETAKQPEKPKVSPLIAHYINIPDSLIFTSNIVIQF